MPISNIFAAFLERPKDVSFETQSPEDEVILLLRRHWLTNVSWILAVMLMIFLPLAAQQLSRFSEFDLVSSAPERLRFVGVLVWYLLTFALAFESFLIWYFNVLIVTDHLIVDVDFWGILGKSVTETPLYNIEDTTYEVNGFLRVLFDFGSVHIQTAGEVPRIEFTDVPSPHKVQQTIISLLKKGEFGKR